MPSRSWGFSCRWPVYLKGVNNMTTSKSTRILYMEDDLGLARLVQKKMRRAGYIVDIAKDGHEGLSMYEDGHYDAVAVDYNLPGYNGLEIIESIASREPATPIVMITGQGDELIAVDAMKLGAGDYVVKDVDGKYFETLPSVVERLLDRKRLLEEKRKVEEQLKSSLREKEILLSEIHHRVKNNMQIITSLLRLQAGKIENKQLAGAFKESETRIRSMALIHERLYQTKDFTTIDFSKYGNSLGKDLYRSYGINGEKVKLKMEIENVFLGLDNAIPCGLIINELISNAMKYAFPKDREGEIKVLFRPMNQDEFELAVSDDGIGIPAEIDFREAETLGLQLVHILAEDQLEGSIALDRDGGRTTFRIRFGKSQQR